MADLFGGYTLEQLKDMDEKATAAPWGSAGGYLTTRNPNSGSFSASIYHLDELGQEHHAGPFQAIPFSRAADAKAIAAYRSAGPALVAEVEKLREALTDIRVATDPDDPESYRTDDREGCLDYVQCKARAALAKTKETSPKDEMGAVAKGESP